ncbi:MAG: hypothetical protein ACYCW6_08615 [Candidatus Xenobia bacterium]
MARVLGRVLLLAVLVAVLLGLCNLAIDRLTPPSIFEQKLRAIDQADLSHVQVVTLGTSRPYQGIDPHLLPWPAYSLCDIHQLLWFSGQVLEHNLPRMPQLRAVVFGIDEFMFGEAAVGPMVPDYLNHGYTVPNLDWMTRMESRVPLMRHRRDLLPALMATLVHHEYYGHPTRIDPGFEPTHPMETTLLTGSGFFWWPPQAKVLTPEKAADRVRDYQDDYAEANRPTNRDLLTRILRVCVSHHLRVALLQTPQTALYRHAADARMLEQFHADLTAVLSQFPADQVRLQSYLDAPFPESEFADVDHINALGARHLSALIASDLATFINAPTVARATR